MSDHPMTQEDRDGNADGPSGMARAAVGADKSIESVGEYVERRRTEAILDATDRVLEDDKEMDRLVKLDHVQPDARTLELYRNVKTAIRECRNLLQTYSRNLEDDEVDRYWLGDPQDPLGRMDFSRSGEVLVFVGLQDVLQGQRYYTEEWEEESERRHGPNEVEPRTALPPFSRDISWAAYDRLREFLAHEVGMSMRIEQQRGPAHIP